MPASPQTTRCFSAAVAAAVLSSLPNPAEGITFRDLLHTGVDHPPRPVGHFLTGHELANITSVACLEARQRDPTIACGVADDVPRGARAFSGPLGAGNYPHWEAPECNMDPAAYMCDPTQALAPGERTDLQAELESLRYDTPVQCRHFQNDGADEPHLRPFYLGVALATDWPRTQQDPASLQWLGESLIAKWNMDHLYTGSFRPYSMCPNSAMLIVLPDSRQAYLASDSCEFICADRGGPEVVSAVLAALDRHGAADAVRVGIREVYRVLGESDPMSATPYRAGSGARSDALGLWNFVQRMLFMLAVLALAGSILVGFVVLLLAPGLIGRLGKRPAQL